MSPSILAKGYIIFGEAETLHSVNLNIWQCMETLKGPTGNIYWDLLAYDEIENIYVSFFSF